MSTIEDLGLFEGTLKAAQAKLNDELCALFAFFNDQLSSIRPSVNSLTFPLQSDTLRTTRLEQMKNNTAGQLSRNLEALYGQLLEEIIRRHNSAEAGNRDFTQPDDVYGLKALERAKVNMIQAMFSEVQFVYDMLMAELGPLTDYQQLARCITQKEETMKMMENEIGYLYNFFETELEFRKLLMPPENFGIPEPIVKQEESAGCPKEQRPMSNDVSSGWTSVEADRWAPPQQNLQNLPPPQQNGFQQHGYQHLPHLTNGWQSPPNASNYNFPNPPNHSNYILHTPPNLQLNVKPTVEQMQAFGSSNVRRHEYKTHWTACPVAGCTYSFKSLIQFSDHQWSIHGRTPHQCLAYRCNRQFDSRDALNFHLESEHSTLAEWPCPVCPRFIANRVGSRGHFILSSHVYLKHFEGCFQCNECNYVANNRFLVKNHYERMHMVAGSHVSDGANGFNESLQEKEALEAAGLLTGKRPFPVLEAPSKKLKTETFSWTAVDDDDDEKEAIQEQPVNSVQAEAPPVSKDRSPIKVCLTQNRQAAVTSEKVTKVANAKSLQKGNHNKENIFKVIMVNCLVDGCAETFEDISQLKEHLRDEHKGGIWACFAEGCQASYKGMKQLIDHLFSGHPQLNHWKCPHCCIVAKMPTAVETYSRLHTHYHLNHQRGLFKCSVCTFEAIHRIEVIHHHKLTHQ